MKTTDFAKCLSSFLSEYLPARRNLSTNTISSYCDTFKLVFKFALEKRDITVERLRLEHFTTDFVYDFLSWLEHDRKCSKSTVNQRLAAIHSFFKYVPSIYPAYIADAQKILSIPFQKKPMPLVNYLEADTIKMILSLPDKATKQGRRDLVVLSLLYDSAMRVSEIIKLNPENIRLAPPAQVVVMHGKGDKARVIPILNNTALLLEQYLTEHRLLNHENGCKPLFVNKQHNRIGRAGIAYILNKYYKNAVLTQSNIPLKTSPHVLRHSKAMHMLQSGVNIVYIRDFLGHSDVATTAVYAKADLTMKREALEKTQLVSFSDVPVWHEDDDLRSWLNSYADSLK
ncbi:MAG: site-specific integrase [Defluviitaleaceae bacterium]|nr:site-specific integrase [Defluviitaleaceae bacterium]